MENALKCPRQHIRSGSGAEDEEERQKEQGGRGIHMKLHHAWMHTRANTRAHKLQLCITDYLQNTKQLTFLHAHHATLQ